MDILVFNMSSHKYWDLSGPHIFFFSSVWQIPVICLLCLGKCSSFFFFLFFFPFDRKCSSFLSINKMVADKYAWSWHIMFEYLLLIFLLFKFNDVAFSKKKKSLMTLHSFLPHTLLQISRKISNAFLIFGRKKKYHVLF